MSTTWNKNADIIEWKNKKIINILIFNSKKNKKFNKIIFISNIVAIAIIFFKSDWQKNFKDISKIENSIKKRNTFILISFIK